MIKEVTHILESYNYYVLKKLEFLLIKFKQFVYEGDNCTATRLVVGRILNKRNYRKDVVSSPQTIVRESVKNLYSVK